MKTSDAMESSDGAQGQRERGDAGSVQGRTARNNARVWFFSFNQLNPAVGENSRGPRTTTQDGYNGAGCAPLQLRKWSLTYMDGCESRRRNA